MPIIKPISDLRNKFNNISEICHEEGSPVFITKNGEWDLVVMSVASYEKQTYLLELYKKLLEAELESSEKSGKTTHREVMGRMQKKLNV